MTKRATPYLFIAPALLHLLLFAIGPIFIAFAISLTDWNLLKPGRPFIGFGNYQGLAGDASFWRSLSNSVVFTVGSVTLGLALALGVAVLLSKPIRGSAFFRTALYLPSVLSQIASAMVWIWVFLPKSGLINAVLGAVGLPDGTDFLNKVEFAMPALILMSALTGLGPRMVLYLAGLLNIPPHLYEAASLDGASPLQTFRSVTWPMLAPTTLFVLVTSAIGAMQMFTPVYMMTKGGPLDSTDVVGYHIYSTAWRGFQIGQASAQSFLLLLVVLALTWLVFRLMKRQMEGYSAA